MKFATAMCLSLLLWQGPAPFARPQEAPTNSSQPASTAAANEKQATAGKTTERLEKLACGPDFVHLRRHTEKTLQPLPEQPPDKGLIYVIRDSSLVGAALPAKFAMDGKWLGSNRVSNYFYIEATPGPHYFCAEANTRGLISLVIEKGATYYLQQRITMGGIDLDLIDAQKGQEYVAKYHRTTIEQKQAN